MDNLSDYELEKTASTPAPAAPPPTHPIGLWISAAVLVAAVCAAAYVAFRLRPLPAVTPSATSAAPAKQPPPSLGGNADPISIPPLDASDAVVRRLVRALTDSPAVAAWLTTNDLIRNFARLYGTFKPRIEEASRELGSQDQTFDRTLERAIVAILETPAVDGPVRLRPKGIGYAYADERLEDLTGAQKQFLRMGPRNVGIIKVKLRQIALALGIPSDQLPAR